MIYINTYHIWCEVSEQYMEWIVVLAGTIHIEPLMYKLFFTAQSTDLLPSINVVK